MDDKQLNRALEAWGKAPMGSNDAVARIVAEAERVAHMAPAVEPGRRWWAWGAGASMVAALALAMLWVQPMAGRGPADDLAVTASADPSASFAMLYSTTAEEEVLL